MHHRLFSVLGLVTVIGCATSNDLKAEASVPEADATKIALSKVEGGSVKKHELEMENGKLVWSFDITSKDGGITEVQVDAKTGDIVSVEQETAQHEAEEEREKK